MTESKGGTTMWIVVQGREVPVDEVGLRGFRVDRSHLAGLRRIPEQGDVYLTVAEGVTEVFTRYWQATIRGRQVIVGSEILADGTCLLMANWRPGDDWEQDGHLSYSKVAHSSTLDPDSLQEVESCRSPVRSEF